MKLKVAYFLAFSSFLGILLGGCSSRPKPTIIQVDRGDIYKAHAFCQDQGRRGVLFLSTHTIQCVNGERIAIEDVHSRG